MEQTKNYGLKKPAPEDFYDVADQNANMDAIDAALKAQEDELEQKAGLDENGKVPASQLPEISLLELGETANTAYRGDHGKLAYEHAMDGTKHITSAEREKLSGIAEGANKTVVDSALSATSTNPLQNKVVDAAVKVLAADILELQEGKADAAALGAKADLVGGKVPASQLPEMEYDAAGSADKVQGKLDAHAGDAEKHITAEERAAWGAKLDASQKGAAGGVAPLGADGKVPESCLNAQGGLVAQGTEPEDVRVGWIDTGNGNVLKFFDGTAWTAVSSVWG